MNVCDNVVHYARELAPLDFKQKNFRYSMHPFYTLPPPLAYRGIGYDCPPHFHF